jgi:TonB-linked SusC/RagA family outer membrane protein
MKIINQILMLIIFLSGTVAFAQQTITGTVTDESGVPLSEATVLIQGTSTAVTTDFDGKFSINASIGDSLEASYVGFSSQSATVDSSIINFLMSTDQLSEVIVTGYGSQSKRTLTDNIASITSDDINGIPTPNAINTLAGKITGVRVSQTNGKIESGFSFRVRGQSSISAGTRPLIVLDGIPLITNNESSNGSPTNPLITLNAGDIKSIDILKDASAASIYGSRGANGVVIITTKSGTKGKNKIDVNISNGWSTKTNGRDWMSANEYIELFREASINAGYPGYEEVYMETISPSWETTDTNWEEIALVDGYTRDFSVASSGGNDKSTYYTSVAHNDTKGIVFGNEMKKISVRSNLETKTKDFLTLGLNINLSRADIDRVANDNAFVTPLQAIALSPVSPAYIDGEPYTDTQYPNFLLQDKYGTYNTIVRRITGRFYGIAEINSDFKFNTSFSYDLYAQSEDSFNGMLTPFQSTNGDAFASNYTTENFIYSNYLQYEKEIGNNHSVSIAVGTELNKSKRRSAAVIGEQFPTDDFQTISSAAEIVSGTGGFTRYSFVSYFARANYNFADKYLLKLGVRRDGSSRFGKDVQFGTFPSVSAGWIISEEDFLSNQSIFSFLKLRASWGEAGNAEIGNFASLGLFGVVSYNQSPGLAFIQADNTNLTWETTTQTDASVQFGLFDDKISGEIGYFVKETNDLLFAEPIPASSGASSLTKNIGSVENAGVEFQLSITNINSNNFKWTTDLNVSTLNNKITELPDDDVIGNLNILSEGEPINAFYLVEYAGVDPDNGDALFYTNKGTEGETSNDWNDAERVIAGNPFPDLMAGLTNSLSYKQFDLSFSFQGEWGASVFNSAGKFQEANGDWFDNQDRSQLRRWQKPGDITDVPRAELVAGNGTEDSTRYLKSTDYIRLKNLTLGYNLPFALIDNVGVSNARVYLSGFNLLTFTDYDGYDPESRSDAGGVGQVFYSAPAAKTIAIGVNLSF